MQNKQIEALKKLVNSHINNMLDLLVEVELIEKENKKYKAILNRIAKLGCGEASVIARRATRGYEI